MRNIIRLFITLGLMFIIGGCSSSGSYSAGDLNKRNLVIDQETEVLSGDNYIAESADAKVKIRHGVNNDKKFITLLSGQGYLVSN